MFPQPDPTISPKLRFPQPDQITIKALETGDVQVRSTYEAFMKCEYERLAAGVAELPDKSKQQRDRLTVLLGQANVMITGAQWEKQPPKRPGVIGTVSELLSEVQDALDLKAPPVQKNLYLGAAINLLRSAVVNALDPKSDPTFRQPVKNAFAKLFGTPPNCEEAEKRFMAIVTLLQDLYDRTNDKGIGFVYAPTLPASMAALASGHGPKAYINVGIAALNGAMPLAELAAVLAHEGSHALPADIATIDVVYKNRFAPYCLGDDVALKNAANYELLVYEVMAVAQFVPKDAVYSRIKGGQITRIEKTQLLTASRITRAWVKTWNFSSMDFSNYGLPSEIGDTLKDLPAGRGFVPLICPYMKLLFETMERLMRLESAMVVVVAPGASRSTHTVAHGVVTVTLPPAIANWSAPDLAKYFVEILVAVVASPIPLDRDDLVKYILKIETVEYPIDGQLTTAFYQTFQ